jgi:hypothetical protein
MCNSNFLTGQQRNWSRKRDKTTYIHEVTQDQSQQHGYVINNLTMLKLSAAIPCQPQGLQSLKIFRLVKIKMERPRPYENQT